MHCYLNVKNQSKTMYWGLYIPRLGFKHFLRICGVQTMVRKVLVQGVRSV